MTECSAEICRAMDGRCRMPPTPEGSRRALNAPQCVSATGSPGNFRYPSDFLHGSPSRSGGSCPDEDDGTS